MLGAHEVNYSYGRVRRRPVFRDFTWSVPEGRRTLLLGPNGVGKSTLLKLLSGYATPSAGTVSLHGDSRRKSLFEGVAWMPQEITPVRGLRVLEQVQYSAWISGRTMADARRESRAALEAVRLTDKSGDLATELSGGQLRRLGLAQALVSRASVILMDEPTAGLDPAQTKNFREIVRGLDAGAGIVVSTHQVGDLDDDFDHVTVLADGRMKFDGSVEQFHAFGRTIGVTNGSVEDIFFHLAEGGMH